MQEEEQRKRKRDLRVWTLFEGKYSFFHRGPFVTGNVHNMPSRHIFSLTCRLSLVVMIFVNYGGGGYWFFSHSAWNGVTVADLVFPWFVWIMGVSVVFSFRGRRDDSYISRLYQVVRRSIILMGLGLFLNNG